MNRVQFELYPLFIGETFTPKGGIEIMKSKTSVALLLGLFSSLALADGNFKLIHVNDLDALMNAKSTNLAIYDANSPDTRKDQGMIPGAHPLSSSGKYNIAKELPTDKNTKLVFYCGNTKCMASHAAAERAHKAGYADVNVMADGIMGWKAAGKPTQAPVN